MAALGICFFCPGLTVNVTVAENLLSTVSNYYFSREVSIYYGVCSNTAVKLKLKTLERTKDVRIKFQDTSNTKLSKDNNITLSVGQNKIYLI